MKNIMCGFVSLMKKKSIFICFFSSILFFICYFCLNYVVLFSYFYNLINNFSFILVFLLGNIDLLFIKDVFVISNFDSVFEFKQLFNYDLSDFIFYNNNDTSGAISDDINGQRNNKNIEGNNADNNSLDNNSLNSDSENESINSDYDSDEENIEYENHLTSLELAKEDCEEEIRVIEDTIKDIDSDLKAREKNSLNNIKDLEIALDETKDTSSKRKRSDSNGYAADLNDLGRQKSLLTEEKKKYDEIVSELNEHKNKKFKGS